MVTVSQTEHRKHQMLKMRQFTLPRRDISSSGIELGWKKQKAGKNKWYYKETAGRTCCN